MIDYDDIMGALKSSTPAKAEELGFDMDAIEDHAERNAAILIADMLGGEQPLSTVKAIFAQALTAGFQLGVLEASQTIQDQERG